MSSIPWKRGDLTDHVQNHVRAEAIYERRLGNVKQVIERCRIQPTNAYERPHYRLVGVTDDHGWTIMAITETLREARRRADRLAVVTQRER